MLLAILGTLIGLAVLTVAADLFVVGAVRLAAHWRLSTVVVGAVVIGFGTSAPEMVVSGLAAGQGSLDLAVGNIVGSNVANLSLVLGAAALITPVVVRSRVLRREAPLSLLLVVAFGIAVQGGLSIGEGVILSTLLLLTLALIMWSARSGDPSMELGVSDYLPDTGLSVGRELLRTLLGLLGTLGGAQLLVASASQVATLLGLSESFIGLTIVAVGTSLPELATSISAARKRETDLIVGNLLGSNIFNAGAVGAVAAFAGAGQVADRSITTIGVGFMVALAVLATGFMVTGRRVVRWEGVGLLVLYVATVPLLFG